MSDFLPPKKKLRLSTPIATKSTIGNNRSHSLNSLPKIFKWDDDKILLLCVGYTRINIKMGIYDI